MTIDFSKQNTIEEKKELTYALYQRFNERYGNLADMNLVKEALDNIVVKEEIDGPLGTTALFHDGKIDVKEDINISTMFHEVLHYITNEHNGVIFSLGYAFSDEELDRLADKYGEKKFREQLWTMDESFTTFITELAIPESDYKNIYEYGVSFLRNFYKELQDSNIDTFFILNMYFKNSPEDGLKFMKPFGDNFEFIMSSIEKSNNSGYIGVIFRAKKENPNITAEEIMGKILTKEELKVLIDEAVSNMKTRS